MISSTCLSTKHIHRYVLKVIFNCAHTHTHTTDRIGTVHKRLRSDFGQEKRIVRKQQRGVVFIKK